MALYLVGDENVNQDSAGFFFLDPHLINSSIPRQEAHKSEHQTDYMPYLGQYHCTDLKTLNPKDMCTSLAPGFYLRDLDNFLQFKEQILDMKRFFQGDCIF